MRIILPLSICILAAGIAVTWWRERHTPVQAAAPAQSFHPTSDIGTSSCTDDKQNDKRPVCANDYLIQAWADLDDLALRAYRTYPYAGFAVFTRDEAEDLTALRAYVHLGDDYASAELENGDFGGC